MVSIHPCDDGALPSTEEGDRAGFDPLPEAVCSSPRSQSLQTEVLPSFSTHDTCNTLGPAKPGGFVTPRKFPAIRAMAVAEGLRVLASRLQVPTRRDMYTPNLLSPLGHHSMPFARPQPWSVLLCAALVLLHVVACLVLLHIGESRCIAGAPLGLRFLWWRPAAMWASVVPSRLVQYLIDQIICRGFVSGRLAAATVLVDALLTLGACGVCWGRACAGLGVGVVVPLAGATLAQQAVLLRGGASAAQRKWARSMGVRGLMFGGIVGGGTAGIYLLRRAPVAAGVACGAWFAVVEGGGVLLLGRLYHAHVHLHKPGAIAGDQRLMLSALVGWIHAVSEGCRMVFLLTTVTLYPSEPTWLLSIATTCTINVLVRSTWARVPVAPCLGPPGAWVRCHGAARWLLGYVRFVGFLGLLLFRAVARPPAWHFTAPTLLCFGAMLAAELVEDALVAVLQRRVWVPRWLDSHAAVYDAYRLQSPYHPKLMDGPSFEWRPLPVYLTYSCCSSSVLLMLCGFLAVLGCRYTLGLTETTEVDLLTWAPFVCPG